MFGNLSQPGILSPTTNHTLQIILRLIHVYDFTMCTFGCIFEARNEILVFKFRIYNVTIGQSNPGLAGEFQTGGDICGKSSATFGNWGVISPRI